MTDPAAVTNIPAAEPQDILPIPVDSNPTDPVGFQPPNLGAVVERDPYVGISSQPVSDAARDILLAPVSETDVEVRPDGILYLPEIKYRRTLNLAFGPGGWALMPRSTHHMQDNTLSREYALFVGGRFISEARGEQELVPKNRQMTYAAAAEAVRSNALLRCCKDLGIASELWDPGFVEAWKTKMAVVVRCDNDKLKWRRRDRLPLFDEQSVVTPGQPAPPRATRPADDFTAPAPPPKKAAKPATPAQPAAAVADPLATQSRQAGKPDLRPSDPPSVEEPRDGRAFFMWIRAVETKLVATQQAKAGELMTRVMEWGKASGHGTQLVRWPADAIGQAVRHINGFLDDLEVKKFATDPTTLPPVKERPVPPAPLAPLNDDGKRGPSLSTWRDLIAPYYRTYGEEAVRAAARRAAVADPHECDATQLQAMHKELVAMEAAGELTAKDPNAVLDQAREKAAASKRRAA